MAMGTLVLIPDGNKGLLVRITSPVRAGIMDEFCVATRPRDCGHSYLHHGKECEACHNSVKAIFETARPDKLVSHLREGGLVEPFYALWFSVEIVGDVDYNGVDGNSIAGRQSVGTWVRNWVLH